MFDPVRVIIVGRPSAGKTILYYDWPKPHCVCDADGKIKNIKYLLRDRVSLKEIKSYDEFDFSDMKNIQYIPSKVQSFDSLYSNLRDILRDPPMNKETGEPGTFTMDSLTSIADQAVSYGLAQRSGAGGKSMGIVPIPDLPEWLGESMFLSSLFTDVQLLPCNVVLTAHMVITEREVMASKGDRAKGLSGGTKITKQLMTGGTKIGNKIPVYFSEVWNAQAFPNLEFGGQPERKLSTVITEECDFVRTKLPLPAVIDYTYNYDNPPEESVWQIVRKAQEEAERMMNG